MMDVEVCPSYFLQSPNDNIKSKTVPEPVEDAAHVTYLLNLENPDGTTQYLQVSEEEAKDWSFVLSGDNNTLTNPVVKEKPTLSSFELPKMQPNNSLPYHTANNVDKQSDPVSIILPSTTSYEIVLNNSTDVTTTKTISPLVMNDINYIIASNPTVQPVKKVLPVKKVKMKVQIKESKTPAASFILQGDVPELVPLSNERPTTTGHFSTSVNNGSGKGAVKIETECTTSSFIRQTVKDLNLGFVSKKSTILKKNVKNSNKKRGSVNQHIIKNLDEVSDVVVQQNQKPLSSLYQSSNGKPLLKSLQGLSSLKESVELQQNSAAEDDNETEGKQNIVENDVQNVEKTIVSEGERTVASQNIIYRVVYPEELDLNPNPVPRLKSKKRGRPLKRTASDSAEEKPSKAEKKSSKPKNMRTRSGRITRPPQHIQKDFKKIEDESSMESDIRVIEFEPLKTNQPGTDKAPLEPTIVDVPRKRSIAGQFRCSYCNKAYLGHSLMVKHLQKHPEHGPIPEYCKSTDFKTWNYLIGICNKKPLGQRAQKFCKELWNLFMNARLLAKFLFKSPSEGDQNQFFVDAELSAILNIESGSYVLNENELNMDAALLSVLSKKPKDNIKEEKPNEAFNLNSFMQECTQSDANKDEKVNSQSFNLTNFVQECTKPNSSASPLCDNNKNLQTNEHLPFETMRSESNFINCHISSTFNSLGGFNAEKITAVENDNNVIHGTHKPITSDLSLHSELLSDNSLLNSLPNLRTSVEEMLNNVDSAHNLLENSTSSDEVMNVDQFVNERFKNFTEPDLELPNTSLNLDLQSLDLFQFHSS